MSQQHHFDFHNNDNNNECCCCTKSPNKHTHDEIDRSGHTVDMYNEESDSESEEFYYTTTVSSKDQQPKQQQQKSVSFGWIHTRVYEITYGEGPSFCSHGPAITLDWQCLYSEPVRHVLAVPPSTNSSSTMTFDAVPAAERQAWLEQRGYQFVVAVLEDDDDDNNYHDNDTTANHDSAPPASLPLWAWPDDDDDDQVGLDVDSRCDNTIPPSWISWYFRRTAV